MMKRRGGNTTLGEKRRQGQRILGGYLLIAAIMLVTVLVFSLGNLRRMLARTFTIHAVFHSAPQLAEGAEVWIGGHVAGEVTRIGFLPVQPDSSPRLTVELQIGRRHRALVRRDSDVRLTSERLIGNPVVDITPGSAASPQLQDGDTLFVAPALKASDLVVELRSFMSALDSLGEDAGKLAAPAQARTRQLARLGQQLEDARRELASLQASFSTRGIDALLDDPALDASLARISEHARALGPAFGEAVARFTNPELRAAFARVQLRARSLSAQIDALRAGSPSSTLARLQSDSALAVALRQAKVELDSLIAETKREPLRWWF